MNIGMLWFDNDPKAGLALKIERAAAYYRSKYGKVPNLCFVHPSMLPATELTGLKESTDKKTYTATGVEIRSNRSVLPNHIWIGINSLA